MDDLELLHNDHVLLGSQVVHVVALLKSLERNPSSAAPLFAELTRQVELLRHQLVEHFAFEEAQSFPTLAANFPQLCPQLEHLRQQHGLLLRVFDELLASLHATHESDWSTAAACSDRLESRFAEHVTAETELLRGLSLASG